MIDFWQYPFYFFGKGLKFSHKKVAKQKKYFIIQQRRISLKLYLLVITRK